MQREGKQCGRLTAVTCTMALLALLEDHANGRIRRERVFRDHIDLLVGYIKICNFMSDHFFF